MAMSESSIARSFDAIQSLLVQHGLQIQDAQVHPAAFGSWYVTVSTAPRLRILWDGKDRWLFLQRETSEIFQGAYIWEDLWIAREPQEQTRDAAVQALLSHVGTA